MGRGEWYLPIDHHVLTTSFLLLTVGCLMIAHDWDDREQWQRSMKLLKDEVVPALPSV